MIKFKGSDWNMLLFYGSIFISLLIIYLYFGISIWDGNPSLVFKIFSAIADSSLMLLPFMFFRGRLKWISLALPFVVSLVLWANLLYFRNFEDLIPPSLYLNNQVADETVVSNIFPSAESGDLLLLLVPFLPIVTAGLLKFHIPQNKKNNWKLAGGLLLIFLFSWGVTWVGAFRRVRIYEGTDNLAETLNCLYPTASSWNFYYQQHNFAGYLVRCVMKYPKKAVPLSENDLLEIQGYFKDKYKSRQSSERLNIEDHPMKDLNLIIIVVESLPMKALEMEHKDQIIPNLSKIMADSATILKKCEDIVGPGRSSDAQFMYNTGLLPLREEPLVDNYASNNYPSIAKILGYESLEVIGENESLWSHDLTTQSYGFNTLISEVSPLGENQDSVIFHEAELQVSKIKEPFYLFITTITMHDPYNYRKVKESLPEYLLEPFPSREEKEYINRLSHFDRSLGEFIDYLKKENIYDNTVIVIAGDHVIKDRRIKSLQDSWVPVIIVNSPLKEYSGRLITQADVFPTILDMFGKDSQFLGVEYSGLGESIFRNIDKDDLTKVTPEDYHISEKIIRSKLP